MTLLNRMTSIVDTYNGINDTVREDDPPRQERFERVGAATVEFLESMTDVVGQAAKEQDVVALMQAFFILSGACEANLAILCAASEAAGFPVAILDVEEQAEEQDGEEVTSEQDG